MFMGITQSLFIIQDILSLRFDTMNPIAVPPKPTLSSADTTNNNSSYYEGNEARFLELSSSIRALYRSIQELREFIHNNDPALADDNDKTDNTHDNDNGVFVDAINENVVLLERQRFELTEIVERMNIMNAHTNVPDDIRIMIVTEEATEKELEELTSETNNDNNIEEGVGVGVHAGSGDAREEDDDEDEDDNDGTNRNDGNAGFYL
mmetsp:Transcript_41927/g.47773  ORF Transcript_41927/g.47773 Transcript_41927/m.47773 type:complete len:207 (+) Transcript_41927:11-631(+)